MSQTRQFQAYVLESAYEGKQIDLRRYVEMTLNIWEKYGLVQSMIIKLHANLQKNLESDVVKEVLNEYENLNIQLEHFINDGIFDNEGNLSELGEELADGKDD